MYARLSGTDRYQALKELAQQARSAMTGTTTAGDYKDFVRDLVKHAEMPYLYHKIRVPLPQGMLVCALVLCPLSAALSGLGPRIAWWCQYD